MYRNTPASGSLSTSLPSVVSESVVSLSTLLAARLVDLRAFASASRAFSLKFFTVEFLNEKRIMKIGAERVEVWPGSSVSGVSSGYGGYGRESDGGVLIFWLA